MLQFLTNNQLYKIHVAALEVLERVGIKTLEKETLKIFDEAGAYVNSKRQIARLPSYLVEDALRKCPKSLVLGARSAEYDVNIRRGRVYTRPSTGFVNVLELENGTFRKGTCKDTAEASMLIDDLKNISMCSTHVLPSDVREEINDVYSFKIALENSRKHIVTSPLTLRNLNYMRRMAIVIRDEEEFRRRPLFSVLNCPLSPLTIRDDISIYCARHRIPTIVNSAPMMGTMSPVTLAGAMVLQSAEGLATITLLQLVNAGSPVIWGNKSTPFDMRFETPLMGAVEIGLLSAGAVQVAHYYDLPAEGFGPRTDSKVLDEQAGLEKAILGMLPALAGAEIVSGAGSIEATATLSLAQLLIDNEFYGMTFRVLKGISFDEERLAVNVIARVGPGGSFLADRHTLKYYKDKDEFYQHELFDKRTRRDWTVAGSRDIQQVAREKVKKMLAEHQPMELSKEEKEKVEDILKEACAQY